MTSETTELVVPADMDIGAARSEAARLSALIAAAGPQSAFVVEISAVTRSALAIQLVQACRTTLGASGRTAALGPVAAAVMGSDAAQCGGGTA